MRDEIEYAPILMISYNRPEMVRETLLNVSRCYDVEKHQIFMYIDGPRSKADVSRIELNVAVVEEFQRTSLPQMEIRRRERNFGCSSNIRVAITELLEKCGRIIVIEDDILVSRTFLQYIENGLRFYKDDHRIWGINAYLDPGMKVPSSYKHSYFLSPRNCVWGWGTWKDRWNAVDFEMRDWKEISNRGEFLKRLKGCGENMMPMLTAQHEGRLNTWDVQITYHMVKNNLYSVRPCLSLTKNNGFGTICEHCDIYSATYAKQKYYNLNIEFTKEVAPNDAMIDCFAAATKSQNLLVRAVRKALRTVHRYVGSSNRHPKDLNVET